MWLLKATILSPLKQGHELIRSAEREHDISLHWFRLFCVIESCIKSIFFYILLAVSSPSLRLKRARYNHLVFSPCAPDVAAKMTHRRRRAGAPRYDSVCCFVQPKPMLRTHTQRSLSPRAADGSPICFVHIFHSINARRKKKIFSSRRSQYV